MKPTTLIATGARPSGKTRSVRNAERASWLVATLRGACVSRMPRSCDMHIRTLRTLCDRSSGPPAASQRKPRLCQGREPPSTKRRSHQCSSYLAKGQPVEAEASRAVAPRADARQSPHQHVGAPAAQTSLSSCSRRAETPVLPAREQCRGGAAASPGHCRRAHRCKSGRMCVSDRATAGHAAKTRLSASCVRDSPSSSSSSAGGTYAAGKVAASQRAKAGATFGSGALPGDARVSNRLVDHGSLTGQMRAVQRHASLSTRLAWQRVVSHLAQRRRHAHKPACVGWRTNAARQCHRCRLLRDAVSRSGRQRR